jgi:signal transduction histidine kinase
VTSRITRAILLVVGLLVLGLGVPLAISVQRFYEDRAVVELQRRAAEATAEISIPLTAANVAKAAKETDSPGAFTVYGADGKKVYGPGPAQGDRLVRRALGGDPAADHGTHELVVTTPIAERVGERVVGVMRVTQAVSVVAGKARRVWLFMAAVVGLAFLASFAIARLQARRLAAPIGRLADQAERIGRGDVAGELVLSGIAELDTVAEALDRSAVRLTELLARERAFSADVSHQLRTPLAGLRLRLEHALVDGGAGEHEQVAGALVEVERLEATVEHLLALARDARPLSDILPVRGVLDAAYDRWHPRFTAADRELHVEVGDRLPAVRGSAVSIGQVLDVLLDNALHHGGGAVSVRARSAVGGLVVEVTDAGQGIPDERLAAVFDRREGAGTGIGLGLARTITEAEGGRLLAVSGRPPVLHLVLPTAPPP